MNKPENYKEIEEFAKNINLDVKYLLGECYEGSLYLSSLKKLSENITFNVGGYLYLSSLKKLPENTTFNVGGDLYLSTLKKLPENTTFNIGGSLDLRSLKKLSTDYKITLKGCVYVDDKEILSKLVYNKL